MSASREKKMRKTTDATPVVNKKDTKKSVPKFLKWVFGIAIAAVAVALLCVSFIFNSSYFHKNSVALTVGEHEVSPAEFNYYFKEAYYEAAQGSDTPSSYLSYMTDFIMDEAIQSVREIYATYDAAIAAGYTLTDEESAELDQEIEDMKASADLMGTSNIDELLANVYGKGCDANSYRRYREMYIISSRYMEDLLDAQDTSDATLDAYYAEHADELDTVSYRQFFLPMQTDMSNTTAVANAILAEAATDETAMDRYALQYAPESNREHYETTENATLLNSISKDAATDEVADWLFEAGRAAGDTIYFENSDATGLYLVRFGSRNTGDYNTVNIRHILISVSDATNAEAMTTAQETAQSYLEEFQNGDQSEESFAALAEAYSDDNADEGGLYEGVFRGQMVAAFEDWCFDESRKSGDSGIVETEYGYHVMYFVGEGPSYRSLNAKNVILDNFYNEWIADATADYEVVEDEFGMGFVTTASASY